MKSDHDSRMARVRTVLDGLSIGDAFGQQFFSVGVRETCLSQRHLPLPRWKYTDDTAMALGIVEILQRDENIDQDALAEVFARRYSVEPDRVYGAGARELLSQLVKGANWRDSSRKLFGSEGSYGNGAAMRVAPIGAYFADDLSEVVEQSRRSAEVTHSHSEGIAGAIAVAVATAVAMVDRSADLLDTTIARTPASMVRNGLIVAQSQGLEEWTHVVAATLGNGSQISAQDTVPFCIWCAAANRRNFTEAMWQTVQVGGDIDTNCAIVGGIVAAAVGDGGIPELWRRARESLWMDSTR